MDDNTLSELKETGAAFAVTPEVLDAYFRSIENPFRETRQGMAEDGGTFKASVVFVFVFSLIPLIPYVFARLATHVFDGRSVSFWRIRIPLASF
jgi:hypothetical protein